MTSRVPCPALPGSSASQCSLLLTVVSIQFTWKDFGSVIVERLKEEENNKKTNKKGSEELTMKKGKKK